MMWLLRFLFTGRRIFVLFALLSSMATIGYLAWRHRYVERVVIQQPHSQSSQQPATVHPQ
jgi:hypothetical protein